MSSDSKVKLLTPKWLNTKFLEEILQNYYKNIEIKVINFEAKSTSANGEGYMSSMYRVEVKFRHSEEHELTTLNLIIKVAVSEETMNAFSNYNIYEKEIEFYGDIAPKINEKLKELGEPQLLPEIFGVCRAKKIMVMDDLGAKGYSILPAQPGYNIAQTKAILKRMAVFHAIGAILQQENTNIFTTSKNFKSGHFSRDVNVYNDMYAGNFDALLHTISTWPEMSAYYEKLQRIRKDIVEKWRRIYDVNPDQFNTLNHDDLWPPNVMVKGDSSSEDTPFDNVIFIDFQMCFWSSPTIDLYFFLNTSVCDSFRPHRFDEFVEFYHTHLVGFLEKLKFKGHIPTWDEFYAQYQERKLLAFITSCLEQAITIDNIGEVGIDDLLNNDEHGMNIKRQLYQKPKVQAILRKMIPYYDEIGTFD